MKIAATTVCYLVSLMMGTTLLAQAGVSSMSVGALRAGIHLRFEDIRVEELVNYHRHAIPLPEDGQRVSLHCNWARSANDKAIFQIGIATPRAIDRDSAQPLNLVLVIDRSGSMSGERMSKVKRSIRTFIKRLRKKDSVAIVSFSDLARVDLTACDKTRKKDIERAIDRIQAGGSTNLHAGLMLGYREVMKQLDEKKSNRVILLTDGIANEGIVASHQIAIESRRFNKKGIDLSTIGLGQDFNRTLLRELADAGRGVVHFVDDSQDIQKTFVNEVDSLLSPAARNVQLTLDFGDGNNMPKLYGYEPIIDDSKVRIRLDNLNCGATQVVVGEWANRKGCINVRLSYVDSLTRQAVKIHRKLDFSNPSHQEGVDRFGLTKNFVIAKVADSIKKCAKQAEKNRYDKAEKKLRRGIKFARKQFEKGCDADVDRVVEIAKNQQQQLIRAIRSNKKQSVSYRH